MAAGSAIVIGAIGLGAWHKQLKGKTVCRVSSKILLQLRRLARSIGYLRNGFMSPGELNAAIKATNYDPALLKGLSFQELTDLKMVAAYEIRYSETRLIALSLNDCHLEYQVTCGDDLDDLLEATNRLVGELMLAVRNHVARNRTDSTPGENPALVEQVIERDNKLLYQLENDEFSRTLVDKVGRIEKILKQHLHK